MNKRWKSILLFFVFVLATFGGLIYMQQRYTTMLQGGGEYQWPVTLERQINWVPGDNLVVHFLGTRTEWTGEKAAQIGKPIYILLGAEPSGILYVKNASDQKPADGLYLIGNVKNAIGNTVEFTIPYNQVPMNLEKINADFYSGHYKGILLATMKIKEGHAVITGVYKKGVPLEEALPEIGAVMRKGESELLTGAPMDESIAKLLSIKEEKEEKDGEPKVITLGTENP